MVFQRNPGWGEVRRSLEGICWFLKLSFAGEGIHDGGFLSPGENALFFAAVFMLCMFCFQISNLGLDLRKTLKFPDI